MIENGKKVKFEYTLIVGGEIVDSSERNGPLEYEHGKGQIISGLERGLEGLEAGDRRNITVGPEDAYGIVDPEAIIEIPRNQIRSENIEVGTILAGKDPNGNPMRGTVIAVESDKVTVDFNHPLAGKELNFEIVIIEIVDKGE